MACREWGGKVIKYGLQPALIVAVLTIWYFHQESPLVYPLVLLGVQLILGVLEYCKPARPDWVQPLGERAVLVAIYVVVFGFSAALVAPFYAATIEPGLSQLRASLGLDMWPSSWPMLAQVILAFLLSEFIWYWFHRAEHRWFWVWRLSGHGAHHSFKHLGALNAGANHPLEMFVLLVPAIIVELFFGAGLAVAGSSVLILTLASIAHTNLDLNHKLIGWVFTTNRFHIHHHSMVMAESNTNYGCAAILWDRLFGTFRDADTVETGIGPTEPSLWEKLLMPYREPRDTQIAP